MDELRSWLILARAGSLHMGTLTSLIEHFGSASTLLNASSASLAAAGASERLAQQLQRCCSETIAADLGWLERSDQHHFIHYADTRYPSLLRQIRDAPVGLYVRGRAEVLNQPQLAMVGSRNPSPAGREIAHEFAFNLSRAGLIITSGLALGIDAACHRGALEADAATVAVCGTGLDVIYPRSHRELAERIGASGALISEFPLGTTALKNNFPRRNRVISGISLGTLVVEAALRSGSLITARAASEQGREVFAIPGSIRNPLARGCHELLRQGAKLVETTQDIICELGPMAAALSVPGDFPASAANPAVRSPLDKEYEILLDALGFEPASCDLLIARTGLNSGDVASMLLLLELDGHVQSHAGGVFTRTRPEAAK